VAIIKIIGNIYNNLQMQQKINQILSDNNINNPIIEKQLLDLFLNEIDNIYSKPIKIELDHWTHTCADNCCYSDGIDIIVNDEKIYNEDGENREQLLKAVLDKIGFKNVDVCSKY
jgi:hypothetical protein